MYRKYRKYGYTARINVGTYLSTLTTVPTYPPTSFPPPPTPPKSSTLRVDFSAPLPLQDIQAGPITSISFSNLPPPVTPHDAANPHTLERFIAPDFVAGTSQGSIVSMTSSAFDESDPNRRTGRRLVPGMLTWIEAVAMHPTRGVVALGGGPTG